MAKIVIDARESGTTTGRYVDNLIEQLHLLKPSHEFIILTSQNRLDYFSRIAPNFDKREVYFKEFTFAEQTNFKNYLLKLKPDLVHFPQAHQPIFYAGSVVSSILDLTTMRFKNPAKQPVIFWFKQQVYKSVVKRVASKSKRLITISDYVKHDVAQYAKVDPAKITVTYPAADEITEPAEPIKSLERTKFILYVGRPLPHKNLTRLIDAFALLKKNQPDLKLVLAGKMDDIYKSHLNYIEQKAIPDILLSGFVSEGQLKWLYQNCQAYVFPSLSEGFGLPGLEAMTHGAPVVSSDATCLPEIYGDAAMYFNPKDVNDIKRAIEQVLSNQTLRQTLISRGQRQVKKYSWYKMAQQTLTVYQEALEK